MDKQFVFLTLCAFGLVLSANVDRQKRSVFGVNKHTAALSQNEIKFYLKELSELQNKLSGRNRKDKSGKRGRKSSKKGGKKSRHSWNQEAPWRAGMHWWETKHGKRRGSSSSSWSSSSSYRCEQPLAYGNTDCTDHTVRYYFEKESKMCRKFHYTGCGGNRNNFSSKYECQRKCKG